MNNALAIASLAVLIGTNVVCAPAAGRAGAERRVVARFVLGVAIFWLVAIAAYLADRTFPA